MKNVYLVGKAGAGKTSAASFLINNYGFRQAKFALPVYNLAYNYLDMKDKDRKLLQVLGTDVGRGLIDYNIWIRRFKEDMIIVERTRELMGMPKVTFILDDCRFPNEHNILKELGWRGVYLEVPEEVRIWRLCGRDGDAKVECLGHKSETEIDLFKDELIKVDADCVMEEMNSRLIKVLGL